MGKFTQALTGALLFATASSATPALAATDIVQAPSNFFVPTDAQKYNAPYYRNGSQDWAWQHNAIGGTFTSALLTISAFDVDSGSGEVDNIYAEDNGVWTLLGALTGTNNNWEYANSFVLGSNFFDDIAAGLNVRIDIDATNSGWVVTLGKSVLTTDGSDLPPPLPGVPEPSTWAMLITGFGLVGAMARRRKSAAIAA